MALHNAHIEVGQAIRHYEIIRELGRGGMGAVFLARDTRLGRLVAIKFLTQRSAQLDRRFLAEARATARCKHEHIVVIHEVGEVDETQQPFMVLEYLEGQTLRTWLDRRIVPDRLPAPGGPERDPVPAGLALELMVPVVRALASAHELGLVHRDLKPENIMLTDAGTIKVLDFGIAKVFAADSDPLIEPMPPRKPDTPAPDAQAPDTQDRSPASPASMTSTGMLVGTLPYMSPEQLLPGGHIDPQSDIWAVGLILYEMVAGQHPLAPLSPAKLEQVRDLDQPMPRVSEQRQLQLGGLGPVIDRCLLKHKSDRTPSAAALLGELEPLSPGRQAIELADDESPFIGLAAFQTSDARRFFGRDRDVRRFQARLGSQPFLTIVGPSGAGKSSFVRAGLIPALERSGEGWEAFILRPGREPMAALVGVLLQLSPRSTSELAGGSASPSESRSPRELIDVLRAQPGYLGVKLRARARHKVRRVLLFVDQFEELYTLCTDPGERAAFVACLEAAADDATSPLRVILTLRSDFLDRVAGDREHMQEAIRGVVFLPAIGRAGLRDALVRPVEQAGHRYETPSMVENMLDALEETHSPLPLLQFAAAQLWQARDRQARLLSQASYDELGGVAGALAKHADTVLAGFSTREQTLVRAIFLRLVTPERTRAMVSLAELREVGQDADAVEHLVHQLAGARLLIIETGDDDAIGLDAADHVLVELSHESLVERWPRLTRWLDEDQEAVQFRARMQAAAREWHRQERTDDLLWRGQAAEEARRWLERWQPDRESHLLGRRDRDFLEAVVELAARARRRRRRAVAAVIASLSVVAVVVSVLAVQARREAAVAKKQAAGARNASRMATAREHLSDPTLVLALMREMEPAGDLPPRWHELTRWATHQNIAAIALPHGERVNVAAFSPDGALIVTASRDAIARVWTADGTGEPVLLEGHEDIINWAAFSPDSSRIVTASNDGTVRIWRADGSSKASVLSQGERVYSAMFSPDGARIVTASWDNTARVWNADGTGTPLVLDGHADRLNSAAFSPDGGRIVTASWDNTARVWNADGTGTPLVLAGHTDRVTSAAFSPDGSRIVTASWDNTARVWNADGTGTPLVLAGHADRVTSAAFDRDGARIVTASWDNSARVWNADGTGTSLFIEGHRDLVNTAFFSPDGTRIITASRDKTARIWNTDRSTKPRFFEGHEAVVYSAAFSPDGRRIVTASADKTARVWNLDGTDPPLRLEGHQDAVYSAAFSPDGRRIVTASADETARVWASDGTGSPLVFEGHQDRVHSAVFSPDGTRIATASLDGTARVWSADGTGEPVVLEGHRNRIYSVAFSPDGARVVTASADKTARVWNSDGTGQPVILEGHQDRVNSASFSPDGTRIVTASYDKSARVWNADGKGEPRLLAGHDAAVAVGTVGGGGFSPDGTRVVTSSSDKTLRVWDVHSAKQLAIVRIPDADVYTAAFSPDGARIVTASHSKKDPVTGAITYWATVWPSIEPIAGPKDRELWLATTYCPTIEQRRELLGVSSKLAHEQLSQCRARVLAARTSRR